jgi:ethanolamine utilization protein EutN
MFIGKVKGNVVTTQKVAKMGGRKLLVVEPLQVDEAKGQFVPTGRCFVAVDNIDAGEGDIVLVTQGSSARMTEATADAPVDCVVIGIVDAVVLGRKSVYRKGG